jgi:phosphoglycolate phosphatase-like HAD superfamily hydrolase
MEFGIRRAIELGNVPPAILKAVTDEAARNNSAIIKRIWAGEERFNDIREPEALLHFINERTPRLFKLYETVLNGASRDRNTADAWKNPEKWRVPGAMEFMAYLHGLRCINYFVTGAVIYEEGGMYEEVKALGFDIGPGRMVEAIQGSQWDKKLPKDEVMKALCREKKIDPAQVLVIGDGRTEIKAGVDMGCVTLSRLPHDAGRLREMHREFGVNYIAEDYTDPVLRKLIAK